MRSLFRKLAPTLCALAARIAPATSSRATLPTVLLYHEVPRTRPGGVEASSFEAQIKLLRDRFDIVPHTEALIARSGKRRVIITFDDGFKNNFTVAAPILKKYNAPAVFFISTRHLEPGKYLWFHHWRGLEPTIPETTLNIGRKDWNFAQPNRAATLREFWNYLTNLQPHPAALYDTLEKHFPPLEKSIPKDRLEDFFAGMIRDELRELSKDPLFTIGNHTHDHPYLTKCAPHEAKRQLALNNSILEEITGQRIQIAAYPIGDYNAATLAAIKQLGIKTAHAVFPKINAEPALEIPRFGLYHASPEILDFKVMHGPKARRLGVNF